MKHTIALATLCLPILLMAACSSTPAPRFHSLLSASNRPAANAQAAPIALDLAAVSVPAAVDQPQWVLRLSDDSLRILEQERWVAPLRDELRAALWEHLATRHGAVDARQAAAARSWRVQVDVQRFESLAGKEVWLDSTWRIDTLSCRSSLREPAVGDVPVVAAAHRRAVARLADEIGARVQALNRGETPACPAL